MAEEPLVHGRYIYTERSVRNPQTKGKRKNIQFSAMSSTVRATVVQASSIFYDTPATLGNVQFLSILQLL